MAIAGAVSIAVLMAVYVAKLRRKETRFGCVRLLALLVGRREGPWKLCQTRTPQCFSVPWPSCFTSACILQHLDYRQTSVLKVLLKHYGAVPCVQLCSDICWSDLSLWCVIVFCMMRLQRGVWAHDGERRAGGQVSRPPYLQPQNYRGNTWVPLALSPLHVTQ